MTWLRAKLRKWLGVDADTAALVELVAGVEKSVMGRCAETQSYAVGASQSTGELVQKWGTGFDKRLANTTEALDLATAATAEVLADHNQRLLDLRDAVVKIETNPEPTKQEPSPGDPAGSWSVIKNRASRGADAA